MGKLGPSTFINFGTGNLVRFQIACNLDYGRTNATWAWITTKIGVPTKQLLIYTLTCVLRLLAAKSQYENRICLHGWSDISRNIAVTKFAPKHRPGFVLFWAFKIPWFSMTFSSFPWQETFSCFPWSFKFFSPHFTLSKRAVFILLSENLITWFLSFPFFNCPSSYFFIP